MYGSDLHEENNGDMANQNIISPTFSRGDLHCRPDQQRNGKNRLKGVHARKNNKIQTINIKIFRVYFKLAIQWEGSIEQIIILVMIKDIIF